MSHHVDCLMQSEESNFVFQVDPSLSPLDQDDRNRENLPEYQLISPPEDFPNTANADLNRRHLTR